MPTQVQHRPSDPHPVGHRAAQHHHHQQQQQIHREALRLALGSILSPKRPPIAPTSRSSSGTASPAFFGAHSSSGAHTPVGTPPINAGSSSSSGSYYPLAHGPNSSEYLHPHSAFGHNHGHGHGHTHQPLPPSRLGRSTSSTSNSPTSSAANSNHPSPHPGMGFDSTMTKSLPVPMDFELLPPAALPHSQGPARHDGAIAPPPTPATPSSANSSVSSIPNSPAGFMVGSRPQITPVQSSEGSELILGGSRSASSGEVPTVEVMMMEEPRSRSGSGSGAGTPRAKFLQTLQSKSAWDALIHGSFS